MKPVDLQTALAAHPRATFLPVIEFNEHKFSAVDIEGVAPGWEMHPDTDEFFYTLEGTFEVTILTADDREHHVVPAGSIVVVPKGLWHKPGAPAGAKILYFTPGESLVSDADDPRVAG